MMTELERKLVTLTSLYNPAGPSAPVDLRAIRFNLTLTPSERLRRNDLMVNITELMHLADTNVLIDVLQVLLKSAQTNPHWNGGEPELVYADIEETD